MTKPKHPSKKIRNTVKACGAQTHLKGTCEHPGTRPDGRCWYHSIHSKPRSLERQKQAADVRRLMLGSLAEASKYDQRSDEFSRHSRYAVEHFMALRQLSYKPLRKRQTRDGMQGTTTRSAMAAFLFNNKGA